MRKAFINSFATAFTIFFFHTTSFGQFIYKSKNFDAKTSEILVVLHGCLQSPESMAFGTGLNSLLENKNIFIIYPKAPADSHPIDCWSWYLSENQSKEKGQLQYIISQVELARKENKISTKQFSVIGISSGAITAAGLAACYPEQILSIGLHSGAAYGLVQSEEAASKLLKEGPPNTTNTERPCSPQNYKGKLVVVQGSSDQVVNPKHANYLITDFLGQNLTEESIDLDSNGTLYTQINFRSKDNNKEKILAKLFSIRGLGHAWSGANLNIKHPKLMGPKTLNPIQTPFFANKGPNASEIFVNEFYPNQK